MPRSRRAATSKPARPRAITVRRTPSRHTSKASDPPSGEAPRASADTWSGGSFLDVVGGASTDTLTSEPITPQAALDYFAARYAATANPVFAWEALTVAIETRTPQPGWLTTYLYTTANRLHALSLSPPGSPSTAVYRALGFESKRGRGPFRAMLDEAHDFMVAVNMWGFMRNGKSYDAALYDTAREHPAVCIRNPKCSRISHSEIGRC